MVRRRVFSEIKWAMEWINMITQKLASIKKAREEIRILSIQIRKDGGLKTGCGCFIHMRIQDLELIIKQSSSQEMLQVIDGLLNSHECEQ